MERLVADERGGTVDGLVVRRVGSEPSDAAQQPPGERGEQDHQRERHREERDRDEGRDREGDQARAVERSAADPLHRLHHDGHHGRGEAGEEAR